MPVCLPVYQNDKLQIFHTLTARNKKDLSHFDLGLFYLG